MTQEKVKLTKEQALALSEAIEAYPEKGFIVHGHVKGAIENQDWKGIFEPLNDIGTDSLCRALYIGYEVVEPDQIVTVTEEKRADLLSVYNFRTEDPKFNSAFGDGMQHALEVLDIHIEGITDKGEPE